jgi:hypothetical protein
VVLLLHWEEFKLLWAVSSTLWSDSEFTGQHCEEAEKFYRDLAAQGVKVRAGMEANGHARWFERLLGELNFELWIGRCRRDP